MTKITYILIAIFYLSISQASSNTFCESFNEDQPVQAGGRVKPLFVLAKESIKFITGKSSYKKENPTQTFCSIFESSLDKKELNFPILVEHVDVKKLLKVDDKIVFLDINILKGEKEILRSEIMRIKEKNSYKKALTKLFNRILTFEGIQNGTTLTLYMKHGEKAEWMAIQHFMDKPKAELSLLLEKSTKLFNEQNPKSTHKLELKYVKAHLFSYALLISLVAIFAVVLLKSLKVGVIVSFIAIGLEIYAMAMRVFISGRAPITNMYETVMFSGFGALVIALFILLFKKDKLFLIAGLGYNILCLFMMMFANNMLDSSISPLVPVLRDNFWLSTHVTTIILSYAALALSWLVANITLFKAKFQTLDKKEYNYYLNLNYICIQVGIVLLAAGIILGGVWADYSWGRFWGWDPKETWSLIVLLYYMVLVHGRYTKWITPHRFTLLSGGGFMTVMMAWFGVNYILATGLHSYGFSQGGAIFLGTFFAIQTTFLIICIKKKS